VSNSGPITESVPLGIMDRSVPSGSRVCAFYAGSAGRDEVVLPFLAEGLRTGHKCIAVLDSVSPADVLARLDDSGVDADSAARAGQIEVETPANAYFGSGTFSTDDTLTFWGHGIGKAKDSGMFAFLRATGEMPSVLGR
jgi:MEDS: MEthanogen/methylotroph, DcmR Sensory domain